MLFARSAVERFRDEYVCGPEMARKLGNTSPASVKRLLTARAFYSEIRRLWEGVRVFQQAHK